jgi:spermidine synthase
MVARTAGGAPPQSRDNRNNDEYSNQGGTVQDGIDIRLFLIAVATGMIVAFGAGVVYGPTPEYLLDPTSTVSPSLMKIGMDAIGASVVTDAVLGKTNQKTKAVKRYPAQHAGELGKVKESHVNVGQVPSYEDLGTGATDRRGEVGSRGVDVTGVTSEDQEEMHQPAGQHLLVDIKNVNAEFLNSEERLAHAMVETVNAAKLTLLSYHCHALEPAGVSCVGVLLESHISFHTWPEEGVITLDLFTCGPNNLMPVVPIIEELFGVPREGSSDKVQTMWSHELRGFRDHEARKAHYLDLSSDLSWYVTSPLEMLVKEEVVSVQTPFQRIDIWDILEVGETPSYEDMKKHNLQPGDPRLLTSELASPDRLLFLDGKLQSFKHTDHEFHESLVHPAMFAHPNPTRVAIIGGGEGATLREVLKHKTVKRVSMVEIDEQMIQVAREYLPFFNDCSDLVNATANCFDDPRADVIVEDAQKWFLSRYATKESAEGQEKFEVVILDAMNPEEDNPNSKGLFTNPEFVSAALNSLTDDGVIVINAGTAPTIHDPAPSKGVYAQREVLFQSLENHPDTQAMLVYEESHCGFNEPHSFLLICKSHSCRKQWYAGADAIDFQIYERIVTTHSKERALKHFDGSTQYTFQFPPKAWETVYCRREPQPFECAFRGLDVKAELRELREDPEESDFYIKQVSDDDIGIFASKPIKKGDYIMPEALASSFVISEESKKNLLETTQVMGGGNTVVLDDFLAFVDKHGHESVAEGIGQTIVEVGGTFLIRSVPDKADSNIDRMIPRPERIPTYSPVYERNRRSFDVFLVASRDIAKGEEILKYDGLWD